MPPLDYDRKCFIFYNKIYHQTPWKIPPFATTKKNGRVSNQGFGVDIFIKISKGMFVDNKNRKRNTLFTFKKTKHSKHRSIEKLRLVVVSVISLDAKLENHY